jgi:integrase
VHFAEYRDQRLKTVKPSTLRRELGTIGHLFTVARIEWGLPIKRSPVADLRIEGTQDRRERRLRAGEWERLMEAAKSRRNPHVIPIIILAVETGMRRGEILAMKWEHFDQDARSLLIPKTKNGHARIIPLSSRATSLLSKLPREGDHIFRMAPNAFRLSWQRVRDRAGLHDLHFHDLRHEAVSRFFERGLTIPEAPW